MRKRETVKKWRDKQENKISLLDKHSASLCCKWCWLGVWLAARGSKGGLWVITMAEFPIRRCFLLKETDRAIIRTIFFRPDWQVLLLPSSCLEYCVPACDTIMQTFKWICLWQLTATFCWGHLCYSLKCDQY